MRTLLQSAVPVKATHAAISDTAVTIYLDQQGNADLTIHAPGANPAFVKMPGWNVTPVADGDYLRISGSAGIIRSESTHKSLRSTVISVIHGGTVFRIRPAVSGMMTASAFTANGKCLWKIPRRYVEAGQSIDVSCGAQPVHNGVMIITVTIDGVKTARTLFRTSR